MIHSIRQILSDQLSGDEQLAGMLAAYNGAPALFYQSAPSDSRGGWGQPRYPRVDFSMDTRHDPERKAQGALTFNIWCTSECIPCGSIDPDKAIERRLVELVGGTFYSGPDGQTVCAEWERSDEFLASEARDKTSHPKVYGTTVTFALLEFPEQISTSPDPIQGLNAWTKKYFPSMTAVAYDTMPPVWKPSDVAPAIYWRAEGAASGNRQNYSVIWFTGTFAAHIIAPSVTERNKWAKAIIERAQIDGEVVLADTSPMFINQIAVRHNADALRDGQLSLTGQYGVLAQAYKEPAQIKLLHPYYNPAKK